MAAMAMAMALAAVADSGVASPAIAAPVARGSEPTEAKLVTLEGRVLANRHDCARDGVCAFDLDAGRLRWRVIYQSGDVPTEGVRADLIHLAWGLRAGDRVRLTASPVPGAAATLVLGGPLATLQQLQALR